MELKEMIQWAIFGKKSYQVHVILWCLCATKISAICTQFCSPAFLIFSAFHINILKTYWEKAAQRHLSTPPQKNQNWKLLLPLITSTITQFKFLFVLLLPCSLVFQMYYIDIVIQFQAKGSVIFMSNPQSPQKEECSLPSRKDSKTYAFCSIENPQRTSTEVNKTVAIVKVTISMKSDTVRGIKSFRIVYNEKPI